MFQLSFLNSGLLILATATVLPLLIWLLAKKKPRRIMFSSLRFIRLSKEQKKNRTKLKDILLLIIRMLIILLVVLAAARPLLKSSKLMASKKHAPTALAIVLDNSFSMDYLIDSQSYLDKAKAAIYKINSLATDNDRLVLITLDEDWNNLNALIYAGKLPQGMVEQIGITHNPIELSGAFKLAEKQLSAIQLANRELYFLSDLQEQELPANPEYPIHIIPLSADILREKPQPLYDNLAVENAQPLPQLVEKNRNQVLHFELSNYGDLDKSDVLVKVVLDDQRVAERFLNIKGKSRITETISFDIRNEGWQKGYVEVLDDKLIHDNRSYFAYPYTLTPRIAVISQKPALPQILRSMLMVYAGNSGKLDTIAPEQLSSQALKDYNLVLVFDPGSQINRLRDLSNELKARNQGILFCLGKSVSSEYKSFLSTSFAMALKDYSSQERSIDYLNPHHYASSLISSSTIKHREVADYWLASSSSASLLAAGNSPLAVSKGRNILWLFDIESSRNRFFLDSAFPVFAYRCFEYLGSSAPELTTYQIGNQVSTETLTDPEGKIYNLSGQNYLLHKPGIYIQQSPDGNTSHFAVNHITEESNYLPMDIAGHSKDGKIKVLPLEFGSQIFFTRLGSDLWKILLILAFLLMILEMIVVKIEENRSPKTSQTD